MEKMSFGTSCDDDEIDIELEQEALADQRVTPAELQMAREWSRCYGGPNPPARKSRDIMLERQAAAGEEDQSVPGWDQSA